MVKKKVKTIGHPVSELRTLISKDEELSIQTQCDLLGISKSGLYYIPKGESEENLTIMELMDERHTYHPTHGGDFCYYKVG